MKSKSKLALATLSLTVLVAGCGTTGELATVGVAGAAAAVGGIFSPSAVDPDYDAYTKACKAEFDARAAGAKEEAVAIRDSITGVTDPTARGALLMLAAVKSLKDVDPRCSVDRKKGFIESAGTNGILGLGMEIYRENRADARFRRQLDFDFKRLQQETFSADDARRDNTDLIRDLAGTYRERNPSPSYSTTTTTIGTPPAAAPAAP